MSPPCLTITLIIPLIFTAFYPPVNSTEVNIHPGKLKCYCSTNPRRSFLLEGIQSNTTNSELDLGPEDIIERLEASVILRDNLVIALGRILLTCLDEDSRIPIKKIHDFIRRKHVPAYDILSILPLLRNKTPYQQLYITLKMLERGSSRYVSLYASLAIESLSKGHLNLGLIKSFDLSKGIDEYLIEYVENDISMSLSESINSLLNAINKKEFELNRRVIAALLSNIPNLDATDPEIFDSLRFVTEYLKSTSKSKDSILKRIGSGTLMDPLKLIQYVLERLEFAKLPNSALRESISILVENLKPITTSNEQIFIGKHYYPEEISRIGNYVKKRLDSNFMNELDIGFYEHGEYLTLQILRKLKNLPKYMYLDKPLSILGSFVAQRARKGKIVTIGFFRAKDYLNSFDVPCLSSKITTGLKDLRPLISNDIPWYYAFGRPMFTDNPWEITISALVNLKNLPLSDFFRNKSDHFIYNVQSDHTTIIPKNSLYDDRIIFHRDDSSIIELDFYSLLTRIPNAFNDQIYVPMLNFFIKPNLLRYLDYRFNQFSHDNPKDLLLDLFNKTLSLPQIREDRPLSISLTKASNYLKTPRLFNIYNSEELEFLLKLLPRIDSDPRYLPLKILFKNNHLHSYLSNDFQLNSLNSPRAHLSVILNTIILKPIDRQLMASIKFALDNIDGPPLPIKSFTKEDFEYLLDKLLPNLKDLTIHILNSTVYSKMDEWNVPIAGGSPENILIRALNQINHSELRDIAEKCIRVLEKQHSIDVPIMKQQTLESILQYIPNNNTFKPIILLLKTSNLLSLVPELKKYNFDNHPPRDNLIKLLKHLKNKKLMRTRVEGLLNDLKTTNRKPNNLLKSYFVQILRNSSASLFKPLFKDMRIYDNVSISLEKREKKLKDYLKNSPFKMAARKALREIDYHDSWKGKKNEIHVALSLLPENCMTEPLAKLLTPTWINHILPDNFNSSHYSEPKELLNSILDYLARRPEVGDNPTLIYAVCRAQKELYGWRNKIQPIRDIINEIKSSVYDSIKDLFNMNNIKRMKISMKDLRSKSPKQQLIHLIDRFMKRPDIKKTDKVSKLLKIVKADVLTFGVDFDLLTILDDMGIPYVDELATLRLFLHKSSTSKDFQQLFDIEKLDEQWKRLITLLRSNNLLHSVEKLVSLLYKNKNDSIYSSGARRTLNKNIVTKSQLNSMLRVVQHVRQINTDFLNLLIDERVLEYLESFRAIEMQDGPDEILRTIIDHLLLLQKANDNRRLIEHLLSFKENYDIIMGERSTTVYELDLIPDANIYKPIKEFIRSNKLLDFLPKNMDSTQKLLNVLETLANNYAFDRNVCEALYEYIKNRTNFIDLDEIDKMLGIASELGLRDIIPFKIFFNRDNLIEYLPSILRLPDKISAREALLEILKELLKNPSLKNNRYLRHVMLEIKKALRNHKRCTREDLNFVEALDLSEFERLKDIMKPEILSTILPKSFSLKNQRTFKTRSIRLLGCLLRVRKYLNDDITKLLERLKSLPDVPRITDEHIRSILDVIPKDREYLKEYLKPSSLIMRFPSDYIINKTNDPKTNLVDVLKTYNQTVGKLKTFVNITIDKLDRKIPPISKAELISLLNEIPFDVYHEILILKEKITPETLTKLNLEQYHSKKLRVIAVLREISKNETFEKHEKEIEFAKQIIEEMPDVPNVTDIEIKNLLSKLPIETYYVKVLKEYCNVDNLLPYLPINFDLNNIKKKKDKLSLIIGYCKMTNTTRNASGKQALFVAEDVLLKLPKREPSEDEIKLILYSIPCDSFAPITSLMTFLNENEISSLLPWDLDLDKHSTFKLKALALIEALRYIKQIQNEQMFKGIDYLKSNAFKLPDRTKYNVEDQSLSDIHMKHINKIIPSNIDWDRLSVTRKMFYIVKYGRYLPELEIKNLQEKLKNLQKNRTIEYMKNLPYLNDYIVFKLFMLGHEQLLSETISRHHTENEIGDDSQTLRIILKALSHVKPINKSLSLSNDARAILNRLSLDGHLTEYDINEAIDEIPNDKKYQTLRLFLKLPYKQIEFENHIKFSWEHSAQSILLDMLNIIKPDQVDSDTWLVIQQLREDVQRAVWDWEIEEMFKKLPNYALHVGHLEALRSHYILRGPIKILGLDYRVKYSNLKDRLEALSKILYSVNDRDLKDSLKYLQNIHSLEIEDKRNIDDVDLKALYVALPKTRNEKLISGIMKFFSTPNLLRLVTKQPFEHKTKGRLLRAILENGLELERVQKDSLQFQALKYFKDRIIMTGPGGQPIELKNFADNSVKNVDLIGLLKAVKSNVEHITVPIALFFETKYNSLLHGVGFDQAAHKTRGTYLKAFLEHLIQALQVPHDIKIQAKGLLSHVVLNGIGAEPVDLNDDHTPDNRIFDDSSTSVDENVDVLLQRSTDVSMNLPNSIESRKKSLQAAIHEELGTPIESKASKKLGEEFKFNLQNEIQKTVDNMNVGLNNSSVTPNEYMTFHPDKVLINTQRPSTKVGENNNNYITMEQAEKMSKTKPLVKPLYSPGLKLPPTVSWIQLPRHQSSKGISKINMQSRKLFVRPDVDEKDKRTVKKDLSKDTLIDATTETSQKHKH